MLCLRKLLHTGLGTNHHSQMSATVVIFYLSSGEFLSGRLKILIKPESAWEIGILLIVQRETEAVLNTFPKSKEVSRTDPRILLSVMLNAEVYVFCMFK